MDGSGIAVTPSESKLDAQLSREPMCDVISLLGAAANRLPAEAREAHLMILEALSVLRQVTQPKATRQVSRQEGGFLAWQVRKILEYIDESIPRQVRVTDLSGLLQLSEAHFSRLFKLTFGHSPHAFVVRRRLELAAHHMVHSAASLSEIALLCGFSDQAHFCKRFRQKSGQTPAAWRRARRLSGSGALALVLSGG